MSFVDADAARALVRLTKESTRGAEEENGKRTRSKWRFLKNWKGTVFWKIE